MLYTFITIDPFLKHEILLWWCYGHKNLSWCLSHYFFLLSLCKSNLEYLTFQMFLMFASDNTEWFKHNIVKKEWLRKILNREIYMYSITSDLSCLFPWTYLLQFWWFFSQPCFTYCDFHLNKRIFLIHMHV